MSKSERIKLDNRLRLLIENGVKTNQRSIICLVGEQGRNQVVHIHNILSKVRIYIFTDCLSEYIICRHYLQLVSLLLNFHVITQMILSIRTLIFVDSNFCDSGHSDRLSIL